MDNSRYKGKQNKIWNWDDMMKAKLLNKFTVLNKLFNVINRKNFCYDSVKSAVDRKP